MAVVLAFAALGGCGTVRRIQNDFGTRFSLGEVSPVKWGAGTTREFSISAVLKAPAGGGDFNYIWDFGLAADAAKAGFPEEIRMARPTVTLGAYREQPFPCSVTVWLDGEEENAQTKPFDLTLTEPISPFRNGPDDKSPCVVTPTRVTRGAEATFAVPVRRGAATHAVWDFGELAEPRVVEGLSPEVRINDVANAGPDYACSVTLFGDYGEQAGPLAFVVEVSDDYISPLAIAVLGGETPNPADDRPAIGPATVQEGTSVKFGYALEKGAAAAHYWDFGDLGKVDDPTAKNPIVQIAALLDLPTAEHACSLTVVDASGNSDHRSFKVQVTRHLVAPIAIAVFGEETPVPDDDKPAIGPTIVQEGKSVKFGYVLRAGTAASRFWDFSDLGQIDDPTALAPTVTINASASLAVNPVTCSLLVSDANGNTDPVEFNVTVRPTPPPASPSFAQLENGSCAVGPAVVQTGKVAAFGYLLATGVATSQFWDFGALGTASDPTAKTPTVNVSVPGDLSSPISCKLYVLGSDGTPLRAEFDVTVQPASADPPLTLAVLQGGIPAIFPLTAVASSEVEFGYLLESGNATSILWDLAAVGTAQNITTANPTVTTRATTGVADCHLALSDGTNLLEEDFQVTIVP